MKVKTSELQGAALDYAVSICEGMKPVIRRNQFNIAVMVAGANEYSSDWSQGGPIIEREEITIDYRDNETQARKWVDSLNNFIEGTAGKKQGCIAAMRCYVASKLGDVVDIPVELIQK